MSCSFDKILSDVKNLTQRLKNTDETTSKIIKDTSYFYVKLKSMNQLQDKISALSNVCNETDKCDLSFDGNMENSNLEKLRVENVELCQLLKEYQTALELIMSRYRADMNDFMHSDQLDVQLRHCHSQHNIELDLAMKYVELHKIAIESSANAESNVDRLQKSIESLHNENESMRQLLGLIDDHFLLDQLDPAQSKWNHLASREERKSSDHLFDASFSDDDRCSVSSDASVKTLI